MPPSGWTSWATALYGAYSDFGAMILLLQFSSSLVSWLLFHIGSINRENIEKFGCATVNGLCHQMHAWVPIREWHFPSQSLRRTPNSIIIMMILVGVEADADEGGRLNELMLTKILHICRFLSAASRVGPVYFACGRATSPSCGRDYGFVYDKPFGCHVRFFIAIFLNSYSDSGGCWVQWFLDKSNPNV